MSAVTFDTLKLVDSLEKADIPREQARAIVDVVRESHDAADVATKGDLRELEHRIETRFARMDGEMKLQRTLLSVTLGGIIAILVRLFF